MAGMDENPDELVQDQDNGLSIKSLFREYRRAQALWYGRLLFYGSLAFLLMCFDQPDWQGRIIVAIMTLIGATAGWCAIRWAKYGRVFV